MNSASRTCVKSLAVLLAALGVFASVTYAAETVLTNGVAVTGISGAAGSEKFYRIDVPAGQDTLTISTSGGSGDVDLYVRRGSQPTTTTYDYRPYKVGNNEDVNVPNPAAGAWYILLRGYSSYSGVTLKATYSASISVKSLTDGVPATGISGAANAELYYSIDVPTGTSKLEIAMSGGTGDADLYVKKGSLPTTTSYDYRPYLSGNNETVTVDTPAAGTWYIMIRGYTAFSGITLLASHGGGGGSGTILENGVAVTNLSGAAGSEKLYHFDLPAGQTNLVIKMSGGTGDADLYVRLKDPPTTTSYDYRPFLTGNEETVTVDAPAAGTWYVMIRSYSDYTGVTLTASWGNVIILQDQVPVPNLSGALDSETFFSINVPAGQDYLDVNISGGTGNADLYVNRGSKPLATSSYAHTVSPSNNDSLRITSDTLQGTWYIMIKGTKAYDGVTIVAHYWVDQSTTPLTNGVPVTNLSGAAGTQKFFSIVVPTGQTKFEVRISNGTGDADLYVRRGSAPTTSTYDYRPDLPGNEEGVTIDNPAAGTWFIMVRGHQAFSGVTLLATYGGTIPDTVITLQNGVAVTGITGTAGGEKFYKIVVPAGQTKLDVVMSGGTGDADLYVRKGSKPTVTDYDYRPYLIGNDESVSIDNPDAATWYIMIRGYSAFTGVTLKATYTPAPDLVTALTNGVPVPGLSGASGSEKFYKIDVPTGQDLLTIETSGGTGDLDLYVKKGAKPTVTNWDYRPYLIGNNEKVEVTNPAAATWYILLRGYQAYSGVTLTATYSTATPPPVGNYFATDPNCVALYRFEADKLTLDSIGTNNLEPSTATADVSNFKEGAASARFTPPAVYVKNAAFFVSDANLAANFPCKSGTPNKRFSICFWTNFQPIPDATNEWTLVTKDNRADGKTTFDVVCGTNQQIALRIGTGTGSTSQSLIHGSKVVSNRWYHIEVTFDDATHTGTVSVWDATAGALLGTDAKKTDFSAISVKDAAFSVGGMDNLWWRTTNGLIDEVVVFNDLLTPDDFAKIRAGTFGKK